MVSAGRCIAGLLAGTASAGLQAQETGTADAWSQTAQDQTSPAAGSARDGSAEDAAPQESIGIPRPDGEPLPPETQRELGAQLKSGPPPQVASSGPPAEDGNIVVTGQRPRGSVIGDIPPELTFNPLDIRAYGASDIGTLIQSLEPQVSSNRGREDSGPVVLVNGKRVSSFTEIANIPTEAVERMEVFPEELALKYGYRADQKVVNIVLFEQFSSQVGQLTYAIPTEGGRDTAGSNAYLVRIRGDTRLNFDVDYTRSGSLRESERDVLQVSGASELGRFRTLLPTAEQIAFNGTVSGNVLGDISSTLNARFEASEGESLLGLGPDGVLTRDVDTRTAHLGTTLGGLVGEWRWTFTGNYDRISTDILTDIGSSGTPDAARSVNSLANANLLLNGSVLELPAGAVSMSLSGGVEMRDFSSSSSRGGVAQRTELSRDQAAIQANFDLPLATRSKEGLAWLGNLSANVNLGVEELSDFDALRTVGYGLNWSPIEQVSLFASVTNEEGAPTVEQLGAPLVVTPNIRTFDFIQGETVDITRIFGGNPSLRSDDRRVFAAGINARPFAETDLNLSINYTSTRTDDPIAAFPIATPEIEAAFPERFTRDGEGRLARIDSRPLNYERSEQEQLRLGVNFTRPLGPVPPPPPGTQILGSRFYTSEAQARAALPPGATMVMVQPGSAAARRMENMASRLILAFYHTWNIEDEILVRGGVPVLDLLDGFATGNRGGTPRHELEFQAGAFKGGLGGRLSVKWQSGTVVRGVPTGAGGTNGDLNFSDYATANISLFANLAERFGGINAPGWLKGMRVSIGITNLFNSRPEVRDEAGLTPLSYQPAYLDPLGRSVNFSLRKIF